MAPSSTSSSNGSNSSGDEWMPKGQRQRRRNRQGAKRTTSEQVTRGIVEQIGINPIVSTIQAEHGGSAPSHSPTPPEHLVVDCAVAKSASKLSISPEIMETKSPDHSADCANGSTSLDRMTPSSTSSSNGSSSSGDEWVPKSQRPRCRKRRGVKRTTSIQVTEGIVEQIGINPVVSTIQVEHGGSAPSYSPTPSEHLVVDCAVAKSASKLSTKPEMETRSPKSPYHGTDCASAKNAPKLPTHPNVLETKSPNINEDFVRPRTIKQLPASTEILKPTSPDQLPASAGASTEILKPKSPDHKPGCISNHYFRREIPALSSGSPRGITVMASPPQPPPATAPVPAVTPAHPATASQPLPRAFLATSAPPRAAAATTPPVPPFVFTARALNANPSPPQQPPATAALPTETPAHPATTSQPLPRAFLATSAPPRAAAATTPPAAPFVFTALALNTNPSPPQQPPATAALTTVTPAHPATASQPLPRAFLATSAPQGAAAATPPPPPPFVFTARALNHNPSPPQQPPANAALPTETPAHPATASQPLPRTFLDTSAPPRAAAATPPPPPPFVFTSRALNPNPRPASPAHGITYPVATSSAAAYQRWAPHVAVGYPRANAVALPIAPSQQPQVPTQPRLPAAAPRAVVAGVTPSPRPELPPRGVPIAPQPQPKVNPVPAVALTPFPQPQEQSNAKERESTKEDSATVVIHGRKVNLSDSESGSLYALCRSWVRNGVPHEIQPSFVGNVAPVLPRPLPASVVDSRMSGKDKEAENEEPKEKKNDTGEYTTAGLLKELVDRAKKIRAELRKERQSRIGRYNQRLALLLPSQPLPPSEPGRHDRGP